MTLIPLLFLLVSILSLTFSYPSLDPRQTSSPQQYYLRTSIVDATNDTGTPKGNLYLTTYHTGAGLSDATLTSNLSYALSGYFNATSNPNTGETQWITNISAIIAGGTPLYWDLCGGVVDYANWQPMTINLEDSAEIYDCEGFYADGDLLVYAYGGWLACDWWHAEPQLFYITPGEADGEPFQAPSSCSLVDLQMIELPATGP